MVHRGEPRASHAAGGLLHAETRIEHSVAAHVQRRAERAGTCFPACREGRAWRGRDGLAGLERDPVERGFQGRARAEDVRPDLATSEEREAEADTGAGGQLSAQLG